MTEHVNIPPDHPRAESLWIREKLIRHFSAGIVALPGLMAHGRGEAFDYLLGEVTTNPALEAMKVAAAMLLAARKPVISVNGNTAALVARDIVKLAQAVDAKIEVNLFYRSVRRELAIKKLLEKAGANEILGFRQEASATIPELNSERRHVDPQGILVSDVVLVPLEDGDRTEALVGMGKNVIAIDLNPLSRTAQRATITIVDNIVRAVPKLVKISEELKKQSIKSRQSILRNFDNRKILAQSITIIKENLSRIAEESGQKTQKG